MNKNIIFLLALSLLVGACHSYSDEMAFYYDDENAVPETHAAPTKGISSQELVVPEELRNKPASPAPKPSSDEESTLSSWFSNMFDENDSSEFQEIPMQHDVDVVSETQIETETFYTSDISPMVYSIVATRVTNKMLDDTQKLYQQKSNKPKLLVQKTEKLNNQLPDGLFYSDKLIFDIINGSQNFTMVTTLDEADYVLYPQVDAFPNPKAKTPIIEYQLTLKDNDGKEIDSWRQDIRQLQNDDKSWW